MSSIIRLGENYVGWHYLKFMLPSKSLKFIMVLIHLVSPYLTFMCSFYKSHTAT